MAEDQENGAAVVEEVVGKGLVAESLARTSRQIKLDRGDLIAEELEISYKRKIEDLRRKIRSISREQKLLFDFAPNNAHSLVMKDVDSETIMNTDLEKALEIYQLQIKLQLAEDRYKVLFNKTVTEE